MLCSRNIFLKFVSCRPIIFGSRCVHKVRKEIFLMDKSTVYFRLSDGSDRFQVLLPFKDKTLNIEREFNFDRQLTEPLGAFLGRVKANVEKLLSRKRKKKNTGETDPNAYTATVELIKDGSPVQEESIICKDVFFNENVSDLRLQLNDTSYFISINSPWVNAIALPACMMANFPVFPVKLELLFSCKSHSLFHWCRAKSKVNSDLLPVMDSEDWENLGTDFIFTPRIEDIGYYLKFKCTPSDGESLGPPLEVTSSCPVGAGPGNCPFETRHIFTSSRLKEKEFRVVSYNVLSDMYAETEEALNNLFSYCPRYALSYDYRRQLLIKEIIGYNADILCLQEVDDKIFEYDLNVILSPMGYSGCYSQKGGTVREGVACFYLQERFNCKDSHTVILADELQKNSCLSDIWECVSKKESLKLRVIDRHTALQVVLLESKENPGELLVIGNTHLYFHPDADHVRLIQAGIIMKYLTNFISVTASHNPACKISLMICGDFNSVPECGIYKLMTTKHVPKDFIDWKSNADESVEDLELNQPWNLESACGTPKYTNFTVGFADCLDYIFYQTDSLAVKQVIPLPSEEELRQHVAIPSVVFPSDHIALVADLCWTN